MLTSDFSDRLEKLKKRIGDKDINLEEFEKEEELILSGGESLSIEFEDKDIQVMLIEIPVMHNMFTNTEEKYKLLPR